MQSLLHRTSLGLLAFALLAGFGRNAHAQCAPGSVTLKVPLYTIAIDASNFITYQQLVGNVTKKATLRADCVGFTTYTFTGTKNLPFANGTQLLISGKNDFNSPVPAPIYLTVNNGSIDGTVTASGAQTGINSDSVRLYLSSLPVMQVKQPWR